MPKINWKLWTDIQDFLLVNRLKVKEVDALLPSEIENINRGLVRTDEALKSFDQTIVAVKKRASGKYE